MNHLCDLSFHDKISQGHRLSVSSVRLNMVKSTYLVELPSNLKLVATLVTLADNIVELLAHLGEVEAIRQEAQNLSQDFIRQVD